MTTKEGRFKARDGLSIFWKTFIPDSAPKALLHIMHGYAEHIDRYKNVIDELVPIAQSDTLARKLEASGVPCKYVKIEGWPHTMDAAQPVNDYCRYFLDEFLATHLPAAQ